ncbi:MAG: hypothetical protein LBT20_06300 [Clostridiales bacterium]|jgi:predicted amidohydrolase|nr:hypothetical protein [Clostridiales bacterium]
MNIVTVRDRGLMEEGGFGELSEGDILIAGFGTTDDFNYMSEFVGKTEDLKRYVRLSGEKKIVLIAATVSRLFGKSYRTAIVVHKGNILGVSDQTHKTRTELTLGNSLKLYETDCGKLGILLGEDIFFPECALALTEAGADRLIYLTELEFQKSADAVLKASAIFCGLNIAAVFKDATVEYGLRGSRNIIDDKAVAVVENSLKKDVRYMKNRRPSVWRSVTVIQKS